MFAPTTFFYDAIDRARGLSYAGDAAAIAAIVRARNPRARTLLDVGCGTGPHLEALESRGFACRGIDNDPKMVALARSRCPDLEIDFADMTRFDLGERFDVVVALAGTTGYARLPTHLTGTIARLAAHVADSGMMIVEPFADRSTYRPGDVDAVFVDEPDLKIARMSLSKQMGAIAILDYNYLIATKTGVDRYFERHELGLFNETQYREAFEAAGLTFAPIHADAAAAGRTYYTGGRLVTAAL